MEEDQTIDVKPNFRFHYIDVKPNIEVLHEKRELQVFSSNFDHDLSSAAKKPDSFKGFIGTRLNENSNDCENTSMMSMFQNKQQNQKMLGFRNQFSSDIRSKIVNGKSFSKFKNGKFDFLQQVLGIQDQQNNTTNIMPHTMKIKDRMRGEILACPSFTTTKNNQDIKSTNVCSDGYQQRLPVHCRTTRSNVCLAGKFYSCDVCNLRFKKNAGLERHKGVHLSLKSNTHGLFKKAVTYNKALKKRRRRQCKLNLKCDPCDKEKQHMSGLVYHLDSKQFTCDLCLKWFSSKPSLVYHLNRHLVEKQFTPASKSTYEDFQQRSRHTPRQKNLLVGIRYLCDVCHKGFSSTARFLFHLNRHLVRKQNSCYICSQNFQNRSGLAYHLNKHLFGKQYTCDVCNKGFLSKTGLAYHLGKHLFRKKYTCDVCNKRFLSKTGWKFHLKGHLTKQLPNKVIQQWSNCSPPQKNPLAGKQFLCDLCNKAFMSSAGLTYHLNRHLTKTIFRHRPRSNCSPPQKNPLVEKQFLCDLCNKAFMSWAGLSYHLNRHLTKNIFQHKPRSNFSPPQKNPLVEKQFLCDLCNKAFMSWAGLRYHLNKHLIKKKFQHRPRSNLTLLQKNSLVRKHFLCDLCDKAFMSSAGLTYHLNQHLRKNIFQHRPRSNCSPPQDKPLGEKHFLCDLCNKAFMSLAGLAYHLNQHLRKNIFQHRPGSNLASQQSKSLIEKHFLCDLCNKVFMSLAGLAYHLKKHLIKNLFQHRPGSNLASLQKNSLVGKQFLCDLCNKAFMSGAGLTYHLNRHLVEKQHVQDVRNKAFQCKPFFTFPQKSCSSYMCDLCNKTFLSAAGLTYHLNRHLVGKRYMRASNIRGFQRRSNLNFPQKIPLAGKQYNCHLCCKSFSSWVSLMHHLSNKHTFNYTCDLCYKVFSSWAGLSYHLKRHFLELKKTIIETQSRFNLINLR